MQVPSRDYNSCPGLTLQLNIPTMRLLYLILTFAVLEHTPILKAASGPERPNILWLTTEDNGAGWLRLYNPDGVATPHIERLAERGIIFNNAFSNAPVCSVARSTIISGSYAPRIGAHYHRAIERGPMPDGLKMFPWYLRQANYYTTNNSKKDYNLEETADTWDVSSGTASYRDRKPGQPFFHVQNFGTTHEGRMHFTREEMGRVKTMDDPDRIKVFPYHPDTPIFRYSYARYRDLHRKVDQEIGDFIGQLEEDGLMDDTIIFFYGDHGGVLPRSKGYVYEDGLQVPMVVYFPDKWKHLAPAALGTRVDGFVSFVDLAPTVLHLAGLNVPKGMDGKPFIGKGVTEARLNARNTTFSYADRMDEKYDLVRTWRKGSWKYIRNFQPFNVDSLYNFYRYRMAAYREWRDLFKAGKLNATQRQFFETRAPEALYDLESDPRELNNLAADPAYAGKLKDLRSELKQHLKSMPDLSFIPEPGFLDEGIDNAVAYGQAKKKRIARLIDIADLGLFPFGKAKSKIAAALRSKDPLERYWGLIACSSFGEEAAPFFEAARAFAGSKTENNLVRMRAAEFLGLSGAGDPRQVLMELIRHPESYADACLMMNTIVLLHDTAGGSEFDLKGVSFPDDWMTALPFPGGRLEPSILAERLEYLTAQ